MNNDDIQYKATYSYRDINQIADNWEKTPSDELLIEQVARGYRNFLKRRGEPLSDGLRRWNQRIDQHKRRNND